MLLLTAPGAQIGVTARNVLPAEAQDIVEGAVIEDVRINGPASRAGLRKGDIVVEFDGETVRYSAQFFRVVGATPPGRTVKATILREGRRREVSITPN
jgi:serine protease Do